MQLCRFTFFCDFVNFGAISAIYATCCRECWTLEAERGLWSQKLGDAMIEKPTMELRSGTAMPKVCDVLLHVLALCVHEA